VGPFTIIRPAELNSLFAFTVIDPETQHNWFEILKAINKLAFTTSIQDFFITLGWHVTRDLNLLSLTMGANSNVSSNKCVHKTIMALNPNQLQVTTNHPQANALSMTCSDHLS
jgi:hypothetical protein